MVDIKCKCQDFTLKSLYFSMPTLFKFVGAFKIIFVFVKNTSLHDYKYVITASQLHTTLFLVSYMKLRYLIFTT